jgi:hypothetical protein
MYKTEKFYIFLKRYKKENDIITGVVKLGKERRNCKNVDLLKEMTRDVDIFELLLFDRED